MHKLQKCHSLKVANFPTALLPSYCALRPPSTNFVTAQRSLTVNIVRLLSRVIFECPVYDKVARQLQPKKSVFCVVYRSYALGVSKLCYSRFLWY